MLNIPNIEKLPAKIANKCCAKNNIAQIMDHINNIISPRIRLINFYYERIVEAAKEISKEDTSVKAAEGSSKNDVLFIQLRIYLTMLLQDICEIVNTATAIVLLSNIPPKRKFNSIYRDFNKSKESIENIFSYLEENVYFKKQIAYTVKNLIEEKNKKILSIDKLCLISVLRNKVSHGRFDVIECSQINGVRVVKLRDDFRMELIDESYKYYDYMKLNNDTIKKENFDNPVLDENIETITLNICNWIDDWADKIVC